MTDTETRQKDSRYRIAIVGTGISGLSAAWLLSKRHDVTVFEAADRVGGHSNTVTFDTDKGPAHVDTGFIVYNEWTYPNLTALFRTLDVQTAASNMSLPFPSTMATLNIPVEPVLACWHRREMCSDHVSGRWLRTSFGFTAMPLATCI